jgi:hypothetical protein
MTSRDTGDANTTIALHTLVALQRYLPLKKASVRSGAIAGLSRSVRGIPFFRDRDEDPITDGRVSVKYHLNMTVNFPTFYARGFPYQRL